MVLNSKPLSSEKSSPSTLGEMFGIVAVTLLLLTRHFHALGTITVGGHIDISLADIAIIILGYIWLIYALAVRFHVHVSRNLIVAILLASLFAIWIGIQAFRSPEPVRGFTMFLLMLRDVAILWLVGSTLRSIRDVPLLNKVVFLIGVGVAVLSLALYSFAALDYQDILGDPSRWHPKIIYELGQAGILRLQGFAGDPNFYSLWMAVSLFCGLIVTEVRRLWKWLGIMAITASIVLAFSRGFFVALGASSLLIVFWLVFAGAKTPWRRYAKPLIGGALAMGIIALVTLPFMQESPARLLISRFQLAPLDPRLGMWKEILNDLPHELLLGKGLRTTEWTLGGMYSHNSYLDLLFETGLIGFVLWVFFAIFVTIRGLNARSAELLPWTHCWLLTLFMFLFFSLLYNPFPWLIAAIIVAFPKRGAACNEI